VAGKSILNRLKLSRNERSRYKMAYERGSDQSAAGDAVPKGA